MRRALTLWVTAAAFAALAVEAPAQSRTHVRDVRVGAHEGYDRVVVELDGPADIAWQRGPEPRAETFYLDADLGRRERVVATQLPELGTISLRAMRVGTRLSLEPRDRRLRAYLLAKPTRLVIDVTGPGEGKFEVPAGLTALAPATSVAPLENAPVPEPQPEAKSEPEAQPEAQAPSKAEPPSVTAEPEKPPAEGLPESSPEAPPESAAAQNPAPESTPPESAPQEAAPQEAAPPESAPSETAPPEPSPPAPAPAPSPLPPEVPPESGFPWGLLLGSLGALAGLAALGAALWRMRAPAPAAPFRPRPNPTPIGVESISLDELRGAADPTTVLEQRLDEEVRARLALEERLAHAGEELKVLRDRLHRVERRRDEAP
jgi:hypothetical protein